MSQTSPVTETVAEDWSCAADFLDDIEVDAKGMCRWTDVANAQTHIRASLRSVQPRGYAQTPTEPHETTYLHGWNEAVERAAEVAEKLHEKPGWSPHYQNAAGAIAKLIRALSDTSTAYNPEFVKEILAADAAPPEATITDISELDSSTDRTSK